LAAKMGVDADKLIAAWSAAGLSTNTTLTTGWMASPRAPSSMGSMGGLKISPKAEVLGSGDKGTTADQPIPGLYAAGETANGQVFYLEYPGSGHSLSLGMTFGFIAGREAAARAQL